MKLLLAASIVLMLSSIAIAIPNSQLLGPYKVSFDLNANYQTQITQPVDSDSSSTYQMILIQNNSTFALIGIKEYTEPQDATLKVHKNLMPMSMIIREGLNASIAKDIKIDGKDGFLIESVPFTEDDNATVVYRAMYWLDSEDFGPVSAGTTSVTITSTYPLDVTEGLLSSLRIVKGEASAAAPANGGQVLPPE